MPNINLDSSLKKKAIKKCLKTPCRYKITALCFNHKDEYIGMSSNSFRKGFYNIDPVTGNYKGIHAEQLAIKKYGRSIKTIIIIRTGNSGNILPIRCCSTCKSLCNKLGIKVFEFKSLE